MKIKIEDWYPDMFFVIKANMFFDDFNSAMKHAYRTDDIVYAVTPRLSAEIRSGYNGDISLIKNCIIKSSSSNIWISNMASFPSEYDREVS